jgi:hypothetical protein
VVATTAALPQQSFEQLEADARMRQIRFVALDWPTAGFPPPPAPPDKQAAMLTRLAFAAAERPRGPSARRLRRLPADHFDHTAVALAAAPASGIVSAAPAHAPVHLANMLADLGDQDGARAAADEAVRVLERLTAVDADWANEELPTALYTQAKTAWEAGDADAARVVLDRAVALNRARVDRVRRAVWPIWRRRWSFLRLSPTEWATSPVRPPKSMRRTRIMNNCSMSAVRASPLISPTDCITRR